MAWDFFNSSKPGYGISKNEPQKTSFFQFWDIVSRKFFKLIQLNLVYVVLCSPIALSFVLMRFNLGIAAFIAFFFSYIWASVVTTGMTYVLRCFVREEHSFIISDIFTTIKRNYKQAVIIGIFDFALINIFNFTIRFYYYNSDVSSLFSIGLAVSILALILFLFMRYYIYLLMITCYATIRQLIKNSFLFAFVGLKSNIFTSFWLALIGFVVYLFYSPNILELTSFLIIVLILSFLIAFVGLIINFNSYPYVKKYLIDPYYAEKNKGKDNSTGQEQPIFKDTVIKKTK